VARASKSSNADLATKVGIGALGAAIGGAIALLFAPSSGKQTRTKVAREGRKAVKATAKVVTKLEKQAGIAAAPAKRAVASKTKSTAKKK
jgi:gas vesicle protein